MGSPQVDLESPNVIFRVQAVRYLCPKSRATSWKYQSDRVRKPCSLFRRIYYGLQHKVRSLRGCSAAARVKLMEHLETWLWRFEVFGLPSRPTRCIDGEQHGRVIVIFVRICIDHGGHRNGTQPHLRLTTTATTCHTSRATVVKWTTRLSGSVW